MACRLFSYRSSDRALRSWDDGFQVLLQLMFGGCFLAFILDFAFQEVAAFSSLASLVTAALLEFVEAVEADDFAEDFLALGGGLVGELVGATLDEEGAVDEGFVVHADDAVDFGLGLADTVAG